MDIVICWRGCRTLKEVTAGVSSSTLSVCRIDHTDRTDGLHDARDEYRGSSQRESCFDFPSNIQSINRTASRVSCLGRRSPSRRSRLQITSSFIFPYYDNCRLRHTGDKDGGRLERFVSEVTKEIVLREILSGDSRKHNPFPVDLSTSAEVCRTTRSSRDASSWSFRRCSFA